MTNKDCDRSTLHIRMYSTLYSTHNLPATWPSTWHQRCAQVKFYLLDFTCLELYLILLAWFLLACFYLVAKFLLDFTWFWLLALVSNTKSVMFILNGKSQIFFTETIFILNGRPNGVCHFSKWPPEMAVFVNIMLQVAFLTQLMNGDNVYLPLPINRRAQIFKMATGNGSFC